MFTNYLKITWRNLLRNRAHTVINLLGLAIGLACTILLAMWIRNELRTDQFHAEVDRLYRILENQSYSGRDIFTVAATPGPMTPALKDNYPEIEYATRLSWGDSRLFSRGEQAFRERGYFADPDFLRMFSYPLLYGDPATALDRPGSAAISRALAEKYFGRPDVVGESITVDDTASYQITGVFEDVPAHSTMEFDFLMPMEEYEARNTWLENWNSNGIRAYLKLYDGVEAAVFAEKLRPFVADNSEQDNVELMLQAYGDIYLRTDFQNGRYQGGGRIVYVRLFMLIAAFILLIACINFMNLSTAQSARRAKEVGIRRVSGATRRGLVGQFLGESVIMTLLAGVVAIGLVRLLLPWFNQLFDVELALADLGLTGWLALGGLLLLTGLLAGSYPAFFLSRYKPVSVLKGLTRRGDGAVWVRKGMVVAQFAIATFLIIGTIVTYRQMEFIRNKNLGFQKENLLSINMMGQMWDKYELIKAELLRTPGVEQVSATNGHIYAWGNNSSGFDWPGKDPEESILFQTIPVDYDFLATIGAELAAGRDFTRERPGDSTAIIVNQTAARLMGMDNPIGQPITSGEFKGTIIGMVRDFNVTSLYNSQDPVLLFLEPYKNFIYVRIRPADVAETLAGIERVVKTHNPSYPFEYDFVDQEYAELYKSEQRTSALARIFAFLAIFVSCLGLFGLAAFTADRKPKEIGIRKVLGAPVGQLFLLMTTDFARWVLLASLIALPMAYYGMSRWLEGFEYRTGIGAGSLALAVVLVLLIALLTVSYQALRVARINPVKTLKYE